MKYKDLFVNGNFMKMFLASAISRFGDGVDMVAYGYMIYELTGSAALMAVLFAVNGIPSLVFNMISGVVVSYLPKKRVIYLADLFRGMIVLVTGILYFTGYLAVWHLYVFTVMSSTFEAFRMPANTSLFVRLISDEELEKATSLNTSVRTFAELMGYATVGIIITFVGVSGAIIIDGVTFFISALLIMLIVMDKEVLTKEKLTLKKYFTELKEGFGYVIKNPLIRFVALFSGGLMFFLSPFNALQIPYVIEAMDLGPTGLSVFNISFMVAMMAGSVSVPFISKTFGYRKMFLLGGSIISFGYMALSMITVFSGQWIGYLALSVVSFFMGMAIPIMSVPIQVTVMKKVERSLLTRVIALISVLSLAAVPIGGGLVGGLSKFIEIPNLFFAFSIGMLVLFVCQFFNRTLYDLDEAKVVDNRESVSL